MTIALPTPDELRRIGGVKWTGITTTDGQPTTGAWVAEMDFGTAPPVAAAMKQAIDDGLLGYQPTWQQQRVAEALARFQQRRFGWEIPTEHIRMVASVMPALSEVLDHLVRPGSPVVVPTPAYMPFLTLPDAHGHPVIEVPSLHDTPGSPDAGGRGWALDLEGIRAGLERGAGLILISNPWNPTGRVLSKGELRDLQAVVSGYDALVFSDEIHSPLVLGDPGAFTSYARLGPEFAAHTVTATAASKGWNIAGLPCGQVILPDDALRDRWDRLVGIGIRHDAVTLGALGSIAAYDRGDPWQAEVRGVIEANIDLVEGALEGSGVDFVRPQGTYLTWWGFRGLGLGTSPARALRDRARIATNAGRTLGRGYEQWVRVNLACSPDVARSIAEGVLRLLDR